MREITLADGKSYEVYMCGDADGVLWIGFTGMTIVQCASILTQNKCSVIIHTVENVTNEYEGYDKLVVVQDDGIGTLCALKREV